MSSRRPKPSSMSISQNSRDCNGDALLADNSLDSTSMSWNTVTRSLPVSFAAVLFCSGCMHTDSSAQVASPTEITIVSQRCEGAGYNPGTDAFINCLQSLGLDRDTATRASSQNSGN